jgi:hypothetical protein
LQENWTSLRVRFHGVKRVCYREDRYWQYLAASSKGEVHLMTSATGWRQIVAAIGMFALGFVCVAELVHLGMSNAQYLHADIRSEKMALLQEWSGKAYSASFGSSHMHNGFDPRIFDKIMAGTPEQTVTINLAIAGGSQSEQRVTALEFVRHMHAPTHAQAQACMVILELTAGANFTNDHLVHPRAINIYDWSTAKFETRLTSSAMPYRQRLGRIGYALAAMGLHYMNVGMLSSSIFPAPLDKEALYEETRDDRRGLLAMSAPAKVVQAVTKEIADSPKHATSTAGMILPGNRELVDELKAASPVHNLLVAYVVMPKLTDLTTWTDFPDTIETKSALVPVVNLARPDLYPQFYHPQYWLDDAHLNEQGAQMATTILAEHLKTWYAAHGEPDPCGR